MDAENKVAIIVGTACVLQAVIRILCAKESSGAEIHGREFLHFIHCKQFVFSALHVQPREILSGEL